jgi:hypothetical protein
MAALVPAFYLGYMAGRPGEELEAACLLAAAIDRAAARLDYANLVVAPQFARADIVMQRSSANYGKPMFNAMAARSCLEEELEFTRARSPLLDRQFAACPTAQQVTDILAKAVERRAKKSSFALGRVLRRRLGSGAPRWQTKGGTVQGRIEAWLVQVNQALMLLRLVPARNRAGSFAQAWGRWKKASAFPTAADTIGRMNFGR